MQETFMRACPAASAVAWTMHPRTLVLLGVAALLALPASVIGLHSAGDGTFTTDTGTRSFSVQLATPIWWDHTTVRGVPTGLTEQTHTLEIRNTAPVTVVAETFPTGTPDTPKVCVPPAAATPVVYPPGVGTAILHPTRCTKENGYTVQIHYFPWTVEPTDPDHVLSPTVATPLATTVWRVDAVPTSYKTAELEPGHWQVWIDPAISPGPYTVTYRATSSQPFYFDYLGHRGCVFYANIATGVNDQAIIGCPNGYV
jgi:hypothetical protein